MTTFIVESAYGFIKETRLKECGGKKRMNLKEIFEQSADENGALTYEQFEALAKESGAKFADLSDGKYVSKSKYDADLKAKDTQIENINSQIENLNQTVSTRDEDLKNLQKQLEDAGQDATKLS